MRAKLDEVGKIPFVQTDSLFPKARFVVLCHEFPPGSERANHWDLMLEDRGELETWQLSAAPAPGKIIAAIKLPRHRLDYLKYEGSVSGGRGSVRRIQAGEFQGTLDFGPDQTGWSIELWWTDSWLSVHFTEQPENRWSVEFSAV